MAFVFETKNRVGVATADSVDVPAVRVTIHRDKNANGKLRYYFAMNQKAVRLGRLMKGDRMTVGFDEELKLLALRRDNENGFTISNGQFSRNKGNAAFQVCLAPESAIATAIAPLLGKWLELHESAGLLIAEVNTPSQSGNQK